MFRLLLSLGAVMFAPALVLAHGIGQRIDLPIPLDLYLVGGAAVVALSFLGIWFLPQNFLAKFTKYPTLELPFLNWAAHPFTQAILRFATLAFFIFIVVAGFIGVENASENILPTTIWIIFSVGVTFFSAFLGNIWKVINPIATIFQLIPERVVKKVPTFQWRDSWGLWPAIGAFLLFRWIENVLPFAAEPNVLAWLVMGYAIYALAGMVLFGKEIWLTKADPFAIFFSFLSRFACIGSEKREGKTIFHLRPPAVGLLREVPSISEVVFVLLMVSGVTADGFFDTPLTESVLLLGATIGLSELVVKTAGLLLLLGVFVALYYGLSWVVTVLMPRVSSTQDFAKNFILSLLPIAVAYEFAHFLSLLILEGQRFISLLSDPFGWGWDIFGTASWTINYGIINLKTLWNIQVFTIVLGHVLAVLVAHAIAEKVFKERDHVLLSQYPMLIVMLLYTMFSLWIIAQPVVV